MATCWSLSTPRARPTSGARLRCNNSQRLRPEILSECPRRNRAEGFQGWTILERQAQQEESVTTQNNQVDAERLGHGRHMGRRIVSKGHKRTERNGIPHRKRRAPLEVNAGWNKKPHHRPTQQEILLGLV